jgi:hypothetical protein
MSSILDALNKLEQEKAQAARDIDQIEIDPATAHDLVGRSVLRDRVTLRVTPATLVMTIGAMMVVLAAVTFGGVMLLMRPATTPNNEQTASAAPWSAVSEPPVASAGTPPPPVPDAPSASALVPAAPQENTAVDAPVVNAPAAGMPVNATPQVDAPAPQPHVAAPPPEATPSPAIVARQPESKPEVPGAAAPESKPEPKVSSPAPVASAPAPVGAPPASDSANTEAPPPAEVKPAPRTTVAAAPVEDDKPASRPIPRRTPPGSSVSVPKQEDVALDRLPIFSQMDQARYGFDRVKVNIARPANDKNPQGSAILTITEESSDGSLIRNQMRFFENQRILDSPLRLFKIEDHRVGIEDVRTGDRYQLGIGI